MGILRLLLALSVVIAHIGPLFGIALLGGKIAVQAFFIISGFYMAFILNEKYVGDNNSYFLYISNRFLRIYPLYWVMLLLTGIFLLLSSHTGVVFRLTPDFVGNAIKQISLFFTIDYLYYDPKTYGNLLIPPSWTLGLELLFYLVAPFIVRNPKRLILLFSFGLISRIIFAHFYIPYPGNYVDRFVPTVAVYFLAGALSYFIYRKVKNFNKTRFLSISAAFLILTLLYQQLLELSNKTIPEIIYFALLMGSLPF